MAMKKNNQITIRLDPLTDPKNKTDAVKTSLTYNYTEKALNRVTIYVKKMMKFNYHQV
jgi:hypothetical protein